MITLLVGLPAESPALLILSTKSKPSTTNANIPVNPLISRRMIRNCDPTNPKLSCRFWLRRIPTDPRIARIFVSSGIKKLSSKTERPPRPLLSSKSPVMIDSFSQHWKIEQPLYPNPSSPLLEIYKYRKRIKIL